MKILLRKTFVGLLLMLLFFPTKAQNFDHYQPILCKGTLPKEITTLSSSKYKAEMAEEEKEQKQRDQAAKAKFLLYQRYLTDNLLKSGKIIVNPELTDYLNEVLDILLKDEPEVRSKIHLYILRSPSVNALAMNDGTILICWGLLAQLENEAQLAYVLSHEITHFKERHILDKFQKNTKQKGKQAAAEREDEAKEEGIVAKYSYAKELESAADSLGLIRFLKTGYSLEAPEQMFEKLKYAYLPFANIPFDKKTLYLADITLPESYWLDSVAKIKGIDEFEDDNSSSHPNLAKRKKAVHTALRGKALDGEYFLVSAEKFLTLQNIARFELTQAYLHYQLYEDAIYNAYILLQENPNNYYSQACIAKALNGIVMRENNPSNSIFTKEIDYGNMKEIEGEMQQVAHVIGAMQPKELNLLALNYAWKLHQKYPQEAEITAIVGELFQQMVNHHYQSSKELEVEKEDKSAWSKSLLQNELKDKDFTAYFESCLKVKTENEAWKKKDFEKFQRKQARKGARLGIDKIVIVNPHYYYQKIGQTKDMGFFTTEKGNLALQETVQEMAKSADLAADLLSLADLKPEDAEKMNEVTLLTEWIGEQSRMPTLGAGTQQNRINDIAKKYNTDYFVWLDVKEVKEVNPFYIYAKLNGLVMGSLIMPWAFPPLINSLSKNYTTAIYATVYDVKTGRSYPLKRKVINKKANSMLLNTEFYDAFAQIKAKDKSKPTTKK